MLSQQHIQAIFKALPSASLILLPDPPDFTIAEVNRTYLQVTETEENDLLGKALFEAFPGNPDESNNTGAKNLRASLQHVLTSKTPHKMNVQRYDIPVRGTDKFEERYWRAENVPVLNEQGEVEFIIHSITDTTKRILSEKKTKTVTNELLKTEEHYWSLFEHNPDAVFSFDLEGNFLSANKAVAELTETSVDELLNITFVPFIADEDKQRVSEHFRQAAAGEIQNYDCDIVTAKGNRRTIKVTNIPIVVKSEIVGVYGIAKDITERKEAEQLLDKAYQLANIGTWEFDMRTHELYWSPVTKQVHGFGPDYEPDLESTIALFKEGINREIFARAARNAIEHKIPFDVELKIISGQGDERWIRATGQPEYKDGVCTRFYGISQNVSDRRKAEEDLQLSEQRFKALVQDGSDLIAILDAEANYKYVAPTSEAILGIPAEDFIGTNALDYIHEDDKEQIARILSELPGNKRVQVSPFRFRDADNNWRWIETTITNMMDDPAVEGFVANSRDVTSQKEEEERLKLLESVITNTTESVIITEAEPAELQERKILYVNEAFTEVTGYTRDEVIGKPLYFLSKTETGDAERLRLREAMKKGEPVEAEFIDYKKNGEAFWIQISAVPVRNQKNEYSHWITIGRDVTERKKYEEEIHNSLKEKETLLAEIHHRVKNNLAVISGLLQLQQFKTKDEELAQILTESEMRIKSMALVHEKLYQWESLSTIRFDEYIEELIESIKQTFDTENKVDYDISCDNIELNINQAVPCALIINELLTNAFKHAFSDRERGEIAVNVKICEQTDAVSITIKDNGKGLPEDFDDKAAESLGFTIIHTLLDQLRADYKVKSPAKGTCVSFTFKKEDITGSSSGLKRYRH